ncbi:MAG: sigma-70 family RNA polymerase sigma factor [Porticoccus sp.]|nr:sigma-70 family RNA polymerase sigma factor [Porticoccus sp.]
MTSTNTQVWSDLLVEMAVTQDKSLYIKLYRHFAPKIKAYIIRLGVADAAAEELVQEAMLNMWRKAHLFNPEKSAASTWLFTLARNQSIDWMRKQKYPEYSLDSLPEYSECVPESDLGEKAVLCERMAQAISQLPESQSQVIYMSFFEGRSHSEIADRLTIPLGSVKSRIRLAVEKLKLTLRGEG